MSFVRVSKISKSKEVNMQYYCILKSLRTGKTIVFRGEREDGKSINKSKVKIILKVRKGVTLDLIEWGMYLRRGILKIYKLHELFYSLS